MWLRLDSIFFVEHLVSDLCQKAKNGKICIWFRLFCCGRHWLLLLLLFFCNHCAQFQFLFFLSTCVCVCKLVWFFAGAICALLHYFTCVFTLYICTSNSRTSIKQHCTFQHPPTEQPVRQATKQKKARHSFGCFQSKSMLWQMVVGMENKLSAYLFVAFKAIIMCPRRIYMYLYV